MEEIEKIKNELISLVAAQMDNTKLVKTDELGKVIDMIKDLAQAEYYHCLAMEKCSETESENEKSKSNFQSEMTAESQPSTTEQKNTTA